MAGWDGRHFLGGGWLSLEASSRSEHNSPGAPLSTHLPARIPPHPPPLQERRPAPVCHPLCEGGPPRLGSGLVRAALSRLDPLSMSGGPTGAVPATHSEPAAPHRLQLQPPACCCLSGAQVLAQSLVLPSLPLGATCSPLSILRPGPGLRVFIKVVKLSTVVSLPGYQKNPCKARVCVCVRACACVSQSPGAPAPHSLLSTFTVEQGGGGERLFPWAGRTSTKQTCSRWRAWRAQALECHSPPAPQSQRPTPLRGGPE